MAAHSYYLRSKPYGFFSLGLPQPNRSTTIVYNKPKVTEPIIEEMKAWSGLPADNDHEGKLGIVNFKEVVDYERCLKNKVVPSNKQYWADYKTNDMMVMRCGCYHLAVCRILSVAREPDTKIQQYLYEGGRKSIFYIRLQPIVKIEEQSTMDTKVTTYLIDNTTIEQMKPYRCWFLNDAHDVVYQDYKKKGIHIPEVMFLYNSWYTANRPEWRILAFKTMLLMLYNLISQATIPLSPIMKMTGKLERDFVYEYMRVK